MSKHSDLFSPRQAPRKKLANSPNSRSDQMPRNPPPQLLPAIDPCAQLLGETALAAASPPHFDASSSTPSEILPARESPLAVIIKGNPKYIEDPRVKSMADKFYAAIALILARGGMRVVFDAGEPHTVPQAGAAAWVAHSRGADRLQYAPPNVLTLEIVADSCMSPEGGADACGFSPSHYRLSAQDIEALEKMVSALSPQRAGPRLRREAPA